jgi:hypothetical protein
LATNAYRCDADGEMISKRGVRASFLAAGAAPHPALRRTEVASIEGANN